MKGISPLVTSVLVIAITIGASVTLLPTIITQANKPLGDVSTSTKTTLDCATAAIAISSLYMADGDLNMKIRNTGQKTFSGYSLYADLEKEFVEVEGFNLTGDFMPGSTAIITYIDFPYVFASNLRVIPKDCPTVRTEYVLKSDTDGRVVRSPERIGDWNENKQLAGYWSFEETLQDRSGNNNNGISYVSSGKNKIPDPSFERSSGIYLVSSAGQSGTPEIVTDPTAPHGTKVAHFIRTSQGSAQYRMYETGVTPGKTYTFSAWGKTNNVVKGADSWNLAFIFGRWIYSNGTEICCMDIGFSAGTNDWQRKSITGTAPAGAAGFRFRFGLSTSTGEAWMDGFQLEEGTLTDFEDPELAWTNGISGKGLTFDGKDDYVQIPNLWTTLGSGSDLTGPLTMTAWIKANSGSGAVISDNNDNEGYIRPNVATSQITFNMQAGTTTVTYPDPTQWHFVSYVSEGANTTLTRYVDGNKTTINQGTCGQYCGPDGFMRIGGGYYLGYFNGTIDEVRVYTRALSEDEIRGIRYLDQP